MSSTSMKKLDGKVALITGAASGIGEATARLFVQHGAKVVIADIQDELGQKVASDLGSSSAIFIHCDVTIESDVENAVNTTVGTFGKLDILHNNAGIIGDLTTSTILESTQYDFEHVLRVNLVGYFLGAKHAARVMIPKRSGSIIMTGSTAGLVGGGEKHAYTSSKHAVVGLTKNVAVELGNYGIRVNCISPYLLDTPLSRAGGYDDEDFKRADTYLDGAVLTKDDVAKAALYLAGDDARYISGHNLVLDGGFSIVNQGFNVFAQTK